MQFKIQELVRMSFSKLGYASYIYDLEPQQLLDGAKELYMMLSSWDGIGIRVAFSFPANLNTFLNAIATVPDKALEAIVNNLAIRIAPTIGKQVPPEVSQVAKSGFDNLLAAIAMPNEMNYPNTLPVGAGGKYWRNQLTPFLYPAPITIDAGEADETIDVGGTPLWANNPFGGNSG
jgi:hypothetical protein